MRAVDYAQFVIIDRAYNEEVKFYFILNILIKIHFASICDQ